MSLKQESKDISRNYKLPTIKRLHILSGNECAHPDCTKKLIGEDGISIIGKICHIKAASKEGPRYDSSMTDEARRGFDNLILLCDEHHTIIDNKENEAKYPVELLNGWKKDHEKKILELVSSKNLLSKYPLALNDVINSIGSKMNDMLDLSEPNVAPNTDLKISFNNVIRYQPIIRQYSAYQIKLNKIYEEIEMEGSVKKELVLNNIKSIYLKIKIGYPTIEDVRENADIILDMVLEEIMDRIDKAPNTLDGLYQETIQLSLMIVIVDAFMRCDILEEPIET